MMKSSVLAHSVTKQTFKVGVNYLFDFGPALVAAKYDFVGYGGRTNPASPAAKSSDARPSAAGAPVPDR